MLDYMQKKIFVEIVFPPFKYTINQHTSYRGVAKSNEYFVFTPIQHTEGIISNWISPLDSDRLSAPLQSQHRKVNEHIPEQLITHLGNEVKSALTGTINQTFETEKAREMYAKSVSRQKNLTIGNTQNRNNQYQLNRRPHLRFWQKV